MAARTKQSRLRRLSGRRIWAVEFAHKETEFRKTLSEFSRPKPNRNNSMILDDRERMLTSFSRAKYQLAKLFVLQRGSLYCFDCRMNEMHNVDLHNYIQYTA